MNCRLLIHSAGACPNRIVPSVSLFLRRRRKLQRVRPVPIWQSAV